MSILERLKAWNKWKPSSVRRLMWFSYAAAAAFAIDVYSGGTFESARPFMYFFFGIGLGTSIGLAAYEE